MAPAAHPGASYVVFGSAAGFKGDGRSLRARRLRRVPDRWRRPYDHLGVSVDAAGRRERRPRIDDLVVGAPGGRGRYSAGYAGGSAFVVFRSSTGFRASLDVAALDGHNGFRIEGAAAGDLAGFSVAGAGDVNGDGIGDVIVGARGADPDGRDAAGSSYVLFGSAAGFGARVDLAALDGSDGFRIDGAAAGDQAAGRYPAPAT
ncbi:MAG: integrin alpha [Amaricoccus sp.]